MMRHVQNLDFIAFQCVFLLFLLALLVFAKTKVLCCLPRTLMRILTKKDGFLLYWKHNLQRLGENFWIEWNQLPRKLFATLLNKKITTECWTRIVYVHDTTFELAHQWNKTKCASFPSPENIQKRLFYKGKTEKSTKNICCSIQMTIDCFGLWFVLFYTCSPRYSKLYCFCVM